MYKVRLAVYVCECVYVWVRKERLLRTHMRNTMGYTKNRDTPNFEEEPGISRFLKPERNDA